MKSANITPKDIDAYLLTQPAPVKSLLEAMRQTIRQAAPQAEEVISYQMPAFKFHGMLVYFAGFKNHIGFYPTTSAINKFKKELSGYAGAKGTVRFPLDEPLPLKLVERIVKFRVKENATKAKLRGPGKSKVAK
jgi:uncharacterized protein YdhG (YjbR/CyaY superfamily)